MEKKFCKFCGEATSVEAVICIKCGRQIEELKSAKKEDIAQPQIIINNANTNTNTMSGMNTGREKSKTVSLLLCFFFGCIGAHKFYEGKILMGIIYLFTLGLFGIGVLIDFIVLLGKPSTYYV
jgi:hypothetical protein